MKEYEKRGYLHQNFRLFHLQDSKVREYDYHYHDFYKVLLLLQGDVTYCIEGRSYSLMPYDMVLVHAGEVHRPIIRDNGLYDRIILYISPDFLRDNQGNDANLASCFSIAREQQSSVLRMGAMNGSTLYHTLLELEDSIHSAKYAGDIYSNALFLQFMVLLNRAVLQSNATFPESRQGNHKILAVLSYLNEHLTQEISIDSLAQNFYTSKYYLMHSFKDETGYSIGSYLSLKRLLLARELIAEGMPVGQACLECGFRNYSTFSRAYKKQFGVSPTRNQPPLIP